MPAFSPQSHPTRTDLETAVRRRLPLVAISFAVALALLGLLAATTSASRPDRPSGQTAPPSVDPNLQLSWLSHDADATTAVAWGTSTTTATSTWPWVTRAHPIA